MKSASQKFQSFKRGLKFAAVGAIAAVAAIGTIAIKTASDMEMLQTQFEVMLGSAEKAKGLMEELKQFAAATPFALQDLAQGTQTLLSFGVAQKDVLTTMRMLGDTAGGNREKLSALVLAFGKVQTKGKVSMEEINMIAERGVPIIGTLVKQLGVTEQQFFKLISAGKVGRKDITQAFRTMTSEGGMFFEGMKKQSLTFAGLLSTMKDNLSLAAAAIGETLLPTAKDLIKTITELVQGPLGELIKGLGESLKPILEILGPLIGMLSTTLLKLAKPLGKLFKFLGELIKKILPPLSKILEVVLDILGDFMDQGLMELLEPLADLLIILLEVLAEILVILNPLLKVILRIVSIALGRSLRLITSGLKVMAKVLRFIFRLLKPIIDLLSVKLSEAAEKLSGIFDKISLKIREIFDTLIKGVTERIFSLIKLVNKIPGIKIELPELEASTGKALQKQIDNSQKKTILNQRNDINVDARGAPGQGPGMTGSQMKGAMRDAAKAAFSLELKKLIISAV